MPTSTRTEPSVADRAGRDTDVSRPAGGGGLVASLAGGTLGILLVAVVAGVLFVRSVDGGEAVRSTSSTEQLIDWLDDHPDDADAWLRLGETYLVDAVARDDSAAYLAADDALVRSLRLDPERPETTRSLAVAAVGLHRFAEGADFATRTLARWPQDRMAMAALVDAQIELGRYDEAADNAAALVSLRPDAVSLPRLSYVHQIRGELDEALSLMLTARTAAAGAPAEIARINLFLAELHHQMGDVGGAESFYELAAAHESMAGRAFVGLAQLAVERGDAASAAELLDRPGVAQDGLTALETRAYLSSLVGDQDGVEQALSRIRAVTEGSLAAGIGVDPGVVLVEADLGDPVRAVELGELVLAAQPGSIAAHDALAWAAHRRGDRVTASEHIELARRTGTLDPRILGHAATIAEQGEERS